MAVSSWAILPEMQANFRSQDSRGLCRFVFPEFPPASFRPLLGMTSWKLPLPTTLLTSNFQLLSFRPECFIISHFQGSKFQPECGNHHDCFFNASAMSLDSLVSAFVAHLPSPHHRRSSRHHRAFSPHVHFIRRSPHPTNPARRCSGPLWPRSVERASIR